MGQKQQTVTVEGHRITLTNLDKVLYPETGTTKGDVLSYYAALLYVPMARRALREGRAARTRPAAG